MLPYLIDKVSRIIKERTASVSFKMLLMMSGSCRALWGRQLMTPASTPLRIISCVDCYNHQFSDYPHLRMLLTLSVSRKVVSRRLVSIDSFSRYWSKGTSLLDSNLAQSLRSST